MNRIFILNWSLFLAMLNFAPMALSQDYEVELNLGEETVSGKKDQPEAMTFVSRAPLDVSGRAIKFKAIERIKKDMVLSGIFDVSHNR